MTDLAREDLSRVMADGALISGSYQSDLRRSADVLFELLRQGGDLSLPVEGTPGTSRPADPEERSMILTCGDMVGRKLARLIEGMAELGAQSMELAGVVALLLQIEGGGCDPAAFYAELKSISDRFRRPYVLVTADGIRHEAADGDPRLDDFSWRSLAVDDVREVVWRHGREISLRQRRMLRRFLLLFALAPGAFFSKEDAVQAVWGVEYHPLRNDPALHMAVLRLRRILGVDGPDILRSADGGYRLLPPPDFMCLVRVEFLSAEARRRVG